MIRRVLAKPILVVILFSTALLGPSAYVRSQDTFVSEQAATQKRDNFDQFIRSELYFGRNISGGGEVSRKDFDKFLAEVITPRFPDGLTVLNARGQFLNSSGEVERERTVVLILLYPVSDRKEKNTRIEEIRAAYKVRFQQQSVLRVDDPAPVLVSF